MVTNTSTDVATALKKAIKLQETEGIPTTVGNSFAPTIEVNPAIVKPADIVKHVNIINDINEVIFTTSKVRETFINSAYLSYAKVATHTGTYMTLTGVINGETVNLLALAFNTTTLERDSTALSYPHPIKLDKDSEVKIVGDGATGAIRTCAGITGYEL